MNRLAASEALLAIITSTGKEWAEVTDDDAGSDEKAPQTLSATPEPGSPWDPAGEDPGQLGEILAA